MLNKKFLNILIVAATILNFCSCYNPSDNFSQKFYEEKNNKTEIKNNILQNCDNQIPEETIFCIELYEGYALTEENIEFQNTISQLMSNENFYSDVIAFFKNICPYLWNVNFVNFFDIDSIEKNINVENFNNIHNELHEKYSELFYFIEDQKFITFDLLNKNYTNKRFKYLSALFNKIIDEKITILFENFEKYQKKLDLTFCQNHKL